MSMMVKVCLDANNVIKSYRVSLRKPRISVGEEVNSQKQNLSNLFI